MGQFPFDMSNMFHPSVALTSRRLDRKPRLIAVFTMLLALSVLMGPIVHAMETVQWAGSHAVEAMDPDHFDGDGDQVPSDFEKGYTHHHAHCHGHQIGEPAGNCGPIGYAHPRREALAFGVAEVMVSASIDPALRPPIA